MPVESMMSPQSPADVTVVKLRKPWLLQQATVVDVVDDVDVDEDDDDVLDVDEVDVVEVLVVDEVEVDDVEVDDVDDVEVDDVDVEDVDDVDVDEVDDVEVVVVPATGQPPGAGASFRLKIVLSFLMGVPPNSAQ
jgi:hypothetical protein